jgi:hypothetical protein
MAYPAHRIRTIRRSVVLQGFCSAQPQSAPNKGSIRTPASEQHQGRDRPDHDELERIPDADKSNDVEPPGRSPVDERSADARGEKVRGGDEHRGHAPLEPAAGANRVEQDVGRHVPAHEVAEVDADKPDDSKHDNSPLMVRQR